MAAKGQTKWKDTMPAQLIEMFSRGKERAHFCAHHSISHTTFDKWLADKPEFAEAYEIAQSKAKAYLLDIADDHLVEEFEGAKLNTKLWSMLMRNRFDLTEHRKIKMAALAKAKTFAEQIQVVMGELAAGTMTASEAQQVAKLIESGVKIYEGTELEKRLAEVEQANKIGFADSEFKEE